mmetsp:Transcript_5350/g.19229  ORF Transcript_5350/g.19229 Transcript_5350/m.19229 type:complete len:208 (-) Transcript_5350:128-751(-)
MCSYRRRRPPQRRSCRHPRPCSQGRVAPRRPRPPGSRCDRHRCSRPASRSDYRSDPSQVSAACARTWQQRSAPRRVRCGLARCLCSPRSAAATCARDCVRRRTARSSCRAGATHSSPGGSTWRHTIQPSPCPARARATPGCLPERCSWRRRCPQTKRHRSGERRPSRRTVSPRHCETTFPHWLRKRRLCSTRRRRTSRWDWLRSRSC